MKILMSTEFFYPSQAAGPSNAVYWQAKALSRAGHHITVIATAKDLPQDITPNKWIQTDYGRVIYLDDNKLSYRIQHLVSCWTVARKVDVIYSNSIFFDGSIVLLTLAKVLRRVFVWAPRGDLSKSALFHVSLPKRLIMSLLRPITNFVTFHSTSPEESEDIRTYFGAGARIKQLENMMEIPKQVNRNAKKYLLFVGRLHPIKAIDKLIDALSISAVFREGEFQLLIAGNIDDGEYSSRLREQVETLGLADKVKFIGSISGQEKEQFYADAYITILPSNAENFGNVVIESLAQGTPVIASTNTPWQSLEEHRVGSWVANDPSVLMREIERYLTMQHEIYDGYRLRAIKFVKEKFDIMSKISEWENFYSEILADRR